MHDFAEKKREEGRHWCSVYKSATRFPSSLLLRINKSNPRLVLCEKQESDSGKILFLRRRQFCPDAPGEEREKGEEKGGAANYNTIFCANRTKKGGNKKGQALSCRAFDKSVSAAPWPGLGDLLGPVAARY